MQSEPLSYYYNRFRLFLFRSPLLKESIVFFLFLQVLRCFSSLRSLLIHYFTYVWVTSLFSLAVFPHSDIYGSMNICFSPQLFAAYHVFLRLLVPRHSPYALSSLTNFFSVKLCLQISLFAFGLIVFILFLVCQFYLSIITIFSKKHYYNFNYFRILSIYFSMCYLDISLPMVEVRRVELLTSCLQGRRSSQTELYPQKTGKSYI